MRIRLYILYNRMLEWYVLIYYELILFFNFRYLNYKIEKWLGREYLEYIYMFDCYLIF